jgi:hypothetical protein
MLMARMMLVLSSSKLLSVCVLSHMMNVQILRTISARFRSASTRTEPMRRRMHVHAFSSCRYFVWYQHGFDQHPPGPNLPRSMCGWSIAHLQHISNTLASH